MLRIHRDNFRAVCLRLRHNQLAGTDQCFLVGKSDSFTGPNGGKGGLQAYHTHHCGNNTVHVGSGCGINQTLFSPADTDGQAGNLFLQLIGCFLRCHNRQCWTVLPALLRHPFHVCTGSQRCYRNI